MRGPKETSKMMLRLQNWVRVRRVSVVCSDWERWWVEDWKGKKQSSVLAIFILRWCLEIHKLLSETHATIVVWTTQDRSEVEMRVVRTKILAELCLWMGLLRDNVQRAKRRRTSMDPCAFPTEDWREDKEDSTKNMPKVQLKSKEN